RCWVHATERDLRQRRRAGDDIQFIDFTDCAYSHEESYCRHLAGHRRHRRCRYYCSPDMDIHMTQDNKPNYRRPDPDEPTEDTPAVKAPDKRGQELTPPSEGS